MATATATDEIRDRREHLGISRLALAVRAGISTTWLAEIEAGLRPRGAALNRVLAALHELELETDGPARARLGVSGVSSGPHARTREPR